jgi:hypothetical protein
MSDSVSVPMIAPESMRIAGMGVLCRLLLAAVDSRPEAVAPFEQAVELAERTGEGNAYGMGFEAAVTMPLWHCGALRRPPM